METHYIIILIILVMGIFGGCVNYFMLTQSTDIDASDKNHMLKKSLFLGVAASILVPLFLNTISSSVITDILANKDTYKSYFIFSGFCLIAAVSSNRFIEDLYDKVIKIEKTAKEAKGVANEAKLSAESAIHETKNLFEAVTEPDESEIKAGLVGTLEADNPTNENIKKLINAFNQSKYSYRTLQGLAKDSGLTEQKTTKLLAELVAQGRIENKINTKGTNVWRIVLK